MKESKPITDESDRVLAQHQKISRGFTDKELAFINYDINYRMGRGNGGDD